MKWTEKYATGIAEIDKQHKALFETCESFREALENNCSAMTYEGFLDFFQLYVEIHFGFEEECMLARNCPSACENQDEHKLCIKVIENEVLHFKENGFDPKRAYRLLEFIDRWLDSHILRVDVKLSESVAI